MHVHIAVSCNDAKQERELIQKIAAHLLRHEVNNVTVILPERCERYADNTVVEVPVEEVLINRENYILPMAIVLAAKKS